MAFSYGPRAGGDGSGGGGSSRVGFSQTTQTVNGSLTYGSFGTVQNSNQDMVTPPFRVSNKSSGLAEVNFGCTVRLSINAPATGDFEYQAKVQARAGDNQEMANATTWKDANLLDDQSTLLNETQHFNNDANITKYLNGVIPFALSVLDSDIADGKFVQFRLQIRVSGSLASNVVNTRATSRSHLAFTAFGVQPSSLDVGPDTLGITENASEAGKAVVVDTAGTGFDLSATVVADDGITRAKIAANAVGTTEIEDGTITHAKIDGDAIDGTNIEDNAIGNEHIKADAVRSSEIQAGAVGESELASQAVAPLKLKGISSVSGESGQVVAINSTEDGFDLITPSSGGGGGTPANNSITHAMLREGIVEQDNMADDSIGADQLIDGSVGNAAMADDAITPAEVAGISTGNSYRGQVLALDTTNGTAFTLREYNTGGGGGSSSFADITGINPTTKGGTGFNASDISDLRNKLGIQSSTNSGVIPYSTNLATQKDGTLERVNTSTGTIPTGLADGVSIRINNDQWAIDLETGKQWKRTLTDTPGTWGTSTNVTLTTANTISALFNLDVGVAGMMTSGNFRPQYPDGNYADKVIVGRHGEHDDDHDDELIAMDRHNFWWAERPSSASDTSITWHWEGTSIIPPGLYYTGGETDEEHIPVGSVAVLGGKTGIDGEEYINVMVGHGYDADTATSTYTGYWIDDDASKTIKATTNTRGYVQGTWSRVETDVDGIADTIISTDTFSGDPVFHGIVPAINSITFEDYTFKTSGDVGTGDVFWNASQRLVRVVAKTADHHLPDLFNQDFEVEIRKDGSNYIRGIFTSAAGPAGVIQAQFRADDLEVVGTISQDDEVDIKGHKAFVSKTETIEPIFLGLSEGSGEANKIVRMNSNGTLFETTSTINADNIPANAITPDKVDGITASGNANQFVKINSTADGFTLGAGSGGGGGVPDDNSVSTAKVQDGAITAPKIALNAIPVPVIQTASASASTYTRIASGVPSEGQFLLTTNDRGRVDWRSADAAVRAVWNTVGSIVEVVDASNNVCRMEIQQVTAASPGTDYDTYRFTNQTGLDDLGATGAMTLRVPALNTSKVAAGAVVNSWVADDAITPSKIEGITATGNANQFVKINSTADGFTVGAGGGGSEPADGSLTLAKFASVYKVLDDSYTFQANVSSGVDDGKFGYTDSGGNGQIAFNVKTADTSAISEWVVDGILVLYKDATNFVVGEITAAPQTEAGDSSEGAVSVIELERQGTFADGDSVKLYYGTKAPPESVLKIGDEGNIGVGLIEPPALGIPALSANGNRIITTNSDAGGFLAVPAANVGMIKASIVMRSNTGNSGNGIQLSGVSTSRVTWPDANNMQTGTWTMQNKATDWLRCNAAGLYYFGHILAQPICVDIELWVRWRTPSAGESFQAWSGGLTSSRIDIVPLGGDRLQITKLFAGGAAILNPGSSGDLVARLEPVTPPQVPDPDDRAHVDCAVPSGDKFCKLSQLNSDIQDGDEVQFTAAFQKQNPSPDYTVRNFFLAIQVMDGGHTYANYS